MTSKFHTAATNPLINGNGVLTDNGDIGYKSTMNALVDLFGRAPNLTKEDDEIVKLFDSVMSHSPELGYRFMQYLRDCRGGAGRRTMFYQLIDFVINKYGLTPELDKILSKIQELGYFKDFLNIKSETLNGAMLREYAIRKYFVPQITTNENAAKYAPRVGKSKYKHLVRIFMHELGLIESKDTNHSDISPSTWATYQRFISGNSKTVEQLITRKAWKEIKFQNVPSKAMLRHTKVFEPLVEYKDYLAKLAKGEVKATSGGTSIPELAALVGRKGKIPSEIVNAQFNDICEKLNISEQIIPVADVSGSMGFPEIQKINGKSVCPIHASVGLSVALAQSNKGAFKNLVMSFSSEPNMMDLSKLKTPSEKMRYVFTSTEHYNTNVDACVDLILTVAIENNVSQDEMPKFIVFFSDMQFDDDSIRGKTFKDRMKLKYLQAGYSMPQVIFWNLAMNSKSALPVTMNDKGVCLVSGYSTNLMNMLFSGDIDMEKIVMKALMNTRYDL